MKDHTPTTVGVDISKAHLDAHELPTGRAERFGNNAAGITKMARWISPDVVCVVYESTGAYHRALEEALAGSLPLTRVNAARARRFAQAIGQDAKTDAVDAKVLAKMGAAVELHRLEPPSSPNANLKVWLYMDLPKPIDLLETKSLHFSRADTRADTPAVPPSHRTGSGRLTVTKSNS